MTGKRILCLTLFLFLMISILVFVPSCAKKPEPIDGVYSSVVIGTGAILEFSNENVGITYYSSDVEVFSVVGTYELDGEYIIFNFNEEDAQSAADFSGAHTFEQGEGYIKIGETKYHKYVIK